jgi:hypothetical protein
LPVARKARASCASGPVIKTAERQKQSQILVAEARSRRRIGERQ